jgi:S-adenosylmethionine-dependent methyltransferase
MRDKTEQVSKFDDLLSFELEYSRSEDFAHLGRYIHIWTEPLAESEVGISENGKEEN